MDLNIYEILNNGNAAIGMDLSSLQTSEGEEKQAILNRMARVNLNMRQAIVQLVEKAKAMDALVNEIYPTAYFHRMEGQMSEYHRHINEKKP